MRSQTQVRYQKIAVDLFGIGSLHKRNPWMALACSVALPGLGHFYCGSYSRAMVLMSFEILVNQLGRVNHAIFLTVLGHADKAQQVIDPRWAMIYPVFYVLAIWDSYRLAVDLNRLCELEERQPARNFPPPMRLSSWEVAHLSPRNPWMAMFLSVFLGGAGHFYNFMSVKAIMLMAWHLAIWLNAGLNHALFAMTRGDWHEVHRALDYQWLLFWPSIHLFNIWNAWVDAVELNKLYEEHLEVWLRNVTGQEKPTLIETGGLP